MTAGATPDELRVLLGQAVVARDHGFRLQAVKPGECTIHVPFTPGLERPGGVIGGPAFMAAADVAMWLAILSRLGPADPAVTVALNSTFLSAARGEDFYCTARVLKWGRRLIYGVAECVTGGERLLTHHSVTYARADEAAPGER